MGDAVHYATGKLVPVWTFTCLKAVQEGNPDLKGIVEWKKDRDERPFWEDVPPKSATVKALLALWGTDCSSERVHFAMGGKLT